MLVLDAKTLKSIRLCLLRLQNPFLLFLNTLIRNMSDSVFGTLYLLSQVRGLFEVMLFVNPPAIVQAEPLV